MTAKAYPEDLVSVVMATYNGERFIAEQIESIISQSYGNIELIIQDDCSTDGTVEIISQFKDRIRIRLEINASRLGFVKNFEKAVQRASGRYIAFCDQDDLWVDHKIMTLVREIGASDLIHSNCELIDENGTVLAPSWKSGKTARCLSAELLFYNDVTGCTALFKRELLAKALPFPEGLAYHDWWIAICASTRNGVKYLNESLVRYRQHGAQDTGAFDGNLPGVISVLRGLRIFNGAAKKAVSRKQLRNLQSGKKYLEGFVSIDIMHDALEYHRSLSTGFFHWRAFIIGAHRCRTVRPGDGLRYLKLLSNDLLG